MLSNAAISNAKPKKKLYRINDGRGLCLEVTPSGSKRWRFRYRFDGKEKMLSLGLYPEVSLKDARTRAEDLRRQLSEGEDPAQQRQKGKAAAQTSFRDLAEEYLERFSTRMIPRTIQEKRRRLELNACPWIGDTPVADITPPMLLQVLRRMEGRGALETAHRTKQVISQVLRYAVSTGRAERDSTQDLKGAIPQPRVKNHPAFTNPKDVAALLRSIEDFKGTYVVHCALRLAPYVFLRPGELRKLEWQEADLEAAEIIIPAEKMKMGRPHVVPLSRQALAILEELQTFTGEGRYVFPSLRTAARPLSENTLNAALRRAGYTKEEMTAHGFRTMASTLLHEQGWRSDIIERQLAHVDKNAVRAVYNKAEFLRERRKMMQAWADFLDALRKGAKVTQLYAAS